VIAPWSVFWDHNRFAATSLAIEALMGSPFVRGAVTGVGVITMIAGLSEVLSLVMSRRREPAGPPQAQQ
jgi:hypothetical protein